MSNTLIGTLVTLNGSTQPPSDKSGILSIEEVRAPSPTAASKLASGDMGYSQESGEGKASAASGGSQLPSSTAAEPGIPSPALAASTSVLKKDAALATPTFSMPSPALPPGCSFLDLSAPPEIKLSTSRQKMSPVTIGANGHLGNLSQYTRNGTKREVYDLNGVFRNNMVRQLSPGGISRVPKRPRSDSLELKHKLKFPKMNKMFPINTPEQRALRPPTHPALPQLGADEVVARRAFTGSRRSGPDASAGGSSKQSAGNGSGSSCHQCKSRCTLASLILCKNTPSSKTKGKRQGCRKKYCDRCLNKFYNENSPVPGQEHKWSCPACRGICRCAACRRQKAKHANGGVLPPTPANA